MDNQRLILYTYTKRSDPSQYIRVGLTYYIGGLNYFTGDNERRGYYLDVQPITALGWGFMIRGFSGTKMFFREANRFSRKRLETLAQEVIQDTDGECADRLSLLMEHVLTKNQIDLSEYDLKQEIEYEPAN